MTDNIKLPEFPKPDGTAEANCIPIRGSDGLVYREYDEVPAWSKPLVEELMREAVRLNATVPDGIPLNVIRNWPDGFNDRLQHVWLDVVSFIPSVKLYDLQRVLAEFGLRMEVYEAVPAAPQPSHQPLTDEQIHKLLTDADEGQEPAEYAVAVIRAVEKAHGIGGKNDH